MSFEEVNDTFFVECEDMLQKIESGLLILKDDPKNFEEIDTIFRAIHTLKGASGMFSYGSIESFAHIFENILQLLRDKKLEVSHDLIVCLLQACDHLGMLVEQASDSSPENTELKFEGEKLKQAMRLFLPENEGSQSDKLNTDINEKLNDGSEYNIKQEDIENLDKNNQPDNKKTKSERLLEIEFTNETFKDGFDPWSFIKYLKDTGTFLNVSTHYKFPKDDTLFDPEDCYLIFKINYLGDLSNSEILDVFELIAADCHIDIQEVDHKKNSIAGSSQSSSNDDLQINSEISESQKQIESKNINSKNNKKTFIRIESQKLDNLIDFVGELVTSSANIHQLSQNHAIKELVESSENLSGLVTQIRDSALQLRMVRVGQLLSKFKRIVHDIAHELGKEVDLELRGTETEMDKSVIEMLSDPLMHILRNAIDHGIEKNRKECGKPANGKIIIDSWHETGEIVIEIRDDGCGINSDAIKKKAIDLGYANAKNVTDQQELYQYLFLPGFSTAKEVTNVSGRGVGLDVVQKNIESLRGKISIHSDSGHGSCFQIRLPLTLAIIDGFLVKVGFSLFVIPLDTIEECIELSEVEISDTNKNIMNIRGEALGIIDTAELLNIDRNKKVIRKNIVIIKYKGQKNGLIVDELLGEIQSVIKPMGKIYGNLKCIGGSTILGDGQVALIIDVISLLEFINHSNESFQIEKDPEIRYAP